MIDGREALKRWREKRGIGQREVADLLGFHESYVSQLLTGKRRPALANAVRIERITGIPVEAWLARRVATAAKAVADTPVSADLAECKA